MQRAELRRLKAGHFSQLVIAARDGSSFRVIHETTNWIEAPNWTADGTLLIFNGDGHLFRIAPQEGAEPQPIDTAPIFNANNDHVLSPDGESIYLSADDGHIYRVPIHGGEPVRISHDREPRRGYRYYLHGISPDGASLAFVGLEAADGRTITRIAILPSAGGTVTDLTDGSCPVDGPEFSPDGQWIYFNSEHGAKRSGHAQIFRMRPDGSDLKQLTHDERVNWFPHPSPDGTLLSYLSYPPGTTGHPADRDVIIRTMNALGGQVRDIDRFNGGQGTINVPSWSPDSRSFAYMRYPKR